MTEDSQNQGLTPDDWQHALDIENACNASGVLHAFTKVADRIREDCRVRQIRFSEHALVIIYLSTLMNICRLGIADLDIYSKAAEEAKAKAQG